MVLVKEAEVLPTKPKQQSRPTDYLFELAQKIHEMKKAQDELTKKVFLN